MGSRYENFYSLLDIVYEMKPLKQTDKLTAVILQYVQDLSSITPIQKDTRQHKSSYHIMHKP